MSKDGFNKVLVEINEGGNGALEHEVNNGGSLYALSVDEGALVELSEEYKAWEVLDSVLGCAFLILKMDKGELLRDRSMAGNFIVDSLIFLSTEFTEVGEKKLA